MYTRHMAVIVGLVIMLLSACSSSNNAGTDSDILFRAHVGRATRGTATLERTFIANGLPSGVTGVVLRVEADSARRIGWLFPGGYLVVGDLLDPSGRNLTLLAAGAEIGPQAAFEKKPPKAPSPVLDMERAPASQCAKARGPSNVLLSPVVEKAAQSPEQFAQIPASEVVRLAQQASGARQYGDGPTIYIFFESTCPHCRGLITRVDALKDLFVEGGVSVKWLPVSALNPASRSEGALLLDHGLDGWRAALDRGAVPTDAAFKAVDENTVLLLKALPPEIWATPAVAWVDASGEAHVQKGAPPDGALRDLVESIRKKK